MSQVQINKTGVIMADGTTSTAAAARADIEYSYIHSNTIGFVEIDQATVKIYDSSVEANNFYEI